MDGQCQGVPCPIASPSRHRVCPKGCCVPRDGESRQHPPEGIRDGALTSLKTPVHLCATLCLSFPAPPQQQEADAGGEKLVPKSESTRSPQNKAEIAGKA